MEKEQDVKVTELKMEDVFDMVQPTQC